MATANTTKRRNGKNAASTRKAATGKGKARKANQAIPATTAESATQAGQAALDWPAENVELNRSLRHRLYCFLEAQEDIDVHVMQGMADGRAEIDFYPRGGGSMNRLALTIVG